MTPPRPRPTWPLLVALAWGCALAGCASPAAAPPSRVSAPLVVSLAGPTTTPLVRDLAIDRRPEPVLLLPSLRRAAEDGPRRAACADPSLAVVSLVVRRAEPVAPVAGSISTALR